MGRGSQRGGGHKGEGRGRGHQEKDGQFHGF